MSKYTVIIKPEGTGKFVNDAGEQIERVCMDVNGRDVQDIRHEGGSGKHAFVFVGEKVEFLHEKEAGKYIESKVPENRP